MTAFGPASNEYATWRRGDRLAVMGILDEKKGSQMSPSFSTHVLSPVNSCKYLLCSFTSPFHTLRLAATT